MRLYLNNGGNSTTQRSFAPATAVLCVLGNLMRRLQRVVSTSTQAHTLQHTGSHSPAHAMPCATGGLYMSLQIVTPNRPYGHECRGGCGRHPRGTCVATWEDPDARTVNEAIFAGEPNFPAPPVSRFKKKRVHTLSCRPHFPLSGTLLS